MRRLFLLSLGLGLAGCGSLGPPATDAAKAIEATLPAAWYAPPLPHQGQPAALAQWWARLGDPVLPELIAEAQAGSASVAAARAQVFAARA